MPLPGRGHCCSAGHRAHSTGCMGTPVRSDSSAQLPGLLHPCSGCRQQAQLVPWSPGCALPLSLGQPWALSCCTGSSWAGALSPAEGSAHTGCAKPGVFFPAELLLAPDCLNFGSIKVQAVQIEPDARSPSHTAPRLMSPSRRCRPGARVLHPSPKRHLQPLWQWL